MKKTLLYFIFFGLLSFGVPEKGPYTPSQIEAFVREVFAEQADPLVFKNDQGRLAFIENFLSRVEIVHKPEYAGKKFRRVSEVGLQSKYDPNLVRDVVCDPKTFNPLKYQFPMASKNKEIYRFDHTDFLIVIQPVK